MSTQTLSPVFDKLTDTVKDRAAGYAHRAVQEPPIRGSPLPPPPPPSPPLPYPPPKDTDCRDQRLGAPFELIP